MADKEEYIIYKGQKFTVEWYFDQNVKSQSRDYFFALDDAGKQKLLYLVKRLGDFGKISDKAINCKNDYEARVKGGAYYDNLRSSNEKS